MHSSAHMRMRATAIVGHEMSQEAHEGITSEQQRRGVSQRWERSWPCCRARHVRQAWDESQMLTMQARMPGQPCAALWSGVVFSCPRRSLQVCKAFWKGTCFPKLVGICWHKSVPGLLATSQCKPAFGSKLSIFHARATCDIQIWHQRLLSASKTIPPATVNAACTMRCLSEHCEASDTAEIACAGFGACTHQHCSASLH